MGKIAFVVNESTIVLGYNGKSFRIKRMNQLSEDVFEETDLSKRILQAIREKKLDTETSPIPAWVDIEESFKGSPFFITHGAVYIDGIAAPKFITDKIIKYKELEIPYESIVAFHRNVLKNPSESARKELFWFLEHNGHPLTEEGYFLAYKAVRTDFYSKYNYLEGSPDNVLNAPQTWVETKREEVDPDRNRTCSNGLHCANYNYAHGVYGSRSDLLIELIVDPKDVVTVPNDYNNQKMRVCRYFVVGPCEGENTNTLYNDWNKSKLVDNNAPTNMVTEGDCEEVDEQVILALDSGLVATDVLVTAPLTGIPTDTIYYNSYENGVGQVWTFSKYITGTQTLIYTNGVGNYQKKSEIKKGDKTPISWKANGPELTGLWPTKNKTIPFFATPGGGVPSFQSVTKDFVGGVVGKKLDLTVAATGGKSTFAASAKAFIGSAPSQPKKVDTKLNYLSQPRVNGKFVKKNP